MTIRIVPRAKFMVLWLCRLRKNPPLPQTVGALPMSNREGFFVKFSSFRAPSPATQQLILNVLLAILIMYLLLHPAYAGTGGTEFETIYTKVKGWVNGYLGKLLALFAFLVGLFYGAIKQNFIVALGGVGIAIMIAVMPALMESLVTAVI